MRGHACAFVCYLHVSFVKRARFTRTGSFVVSVPIWLKLLFVPAVGVAALCSRDKDLLTNLFGSRAVTIFGLIQ